MAIFMPVSYTHLDVYKRQALEDIIDTYADDPYNPDSPTHQIYVPIQNPLVPPTATVGAVLTLNSFWYSSDGSSFDITEEGYFDDSTFQWDYAWSSLYEMCIRDSQCGDV